MLEAYGGMYSTAVFVWSYEYSGGCGWMPYFGRNKVEFNVFQLLTMCVFDCFLLLNRNDFHDGFK